MKRTLTVAALTITLLGVSGSAFAAWLANTNSGQGSTSALSMPAGNTPTAPANSTGSVTLTWTAAQLAGNDLTTYTVRRYPSAGGAGTVITCASQTITDHMVSCTYNETAAGSYQFTDTPHHANWVGAESAKSGTTTVTLTVTRTFTVAPAAGDRTAGSAFSVTLTALTNGVVDTSYTGNHTIAFSGPSNSPSPTDQAPSYPSTVTFVAGVGTTSITLYKAETATLTASETTPARSGSASVTVVAGSQNKLAFSVACPGTDMAKNSTWTTAVDILDQWSNPTVHGSLARTINLASSTPGNGSLGASSVTVAANADPARSGTFTYTADNASNKTTTITASVTGLPALTSATCTLGT